jgi:hypothetical protein
MFLLFMKGFIVSKNLRYTDDTCKMAELHVMASDRRNKERRFFCDRL